MSEGGRAAGYPADVRDEQAVETALAQKVNQFGKINVLVSAGPEISCAKRRK
jgi:NAD(P)-dependent dehydrogenase (short-subunit alcohol dehydrogenase family)